MASEQGRATKPRFPACARIAVPVTDWGFLPGGRRLFRTVHLTDVTAAGS